MITATAPLLNETRDNLNELEGDFNNEGQGTWVGKGGRKMPQLLDNLHYSYYIGFITRYFPPSTFTPIGSRTL